jgi:hypothetical protein
MLVALVVIFLSGCGSEKISSTDDLQQVNKIDSSAEEELSIDDIRQVYISEEEPPITRCFEGDDFILQIIKVDREKYSHSYSYSIYVLPKSEENINPGEKYKKKVVYLLRSLDLSIEDCQIDYGQFVYDPESSGC